MTNYPEIQIGCERNEAGELIIRIGGALCGTVEGFKRAIALFEQGEPRRLDYDDLAFSTAVVAAVKRAQLRGML